MKEKQYLFVTGFLRSGTTLLEKRLHMLEEVCVAPQPFPLIYTEIKKRFLKQLGAENARYPLGHLFNERATCADFTAFLDQERFDKSAIQFALESMRDYSGCHLPAITDARLPKSDQKLVDWFHYLIDQASLLLDCGDRRILGSKEVFCEEYLPYFCNNGVKAVLILRDPRAVVASIRGDLQGDFVDSKMDLLHVIRQWRKSVAISLMLNGSPNFRRVLFEDLKNDSAGVMGDLSRWLGVASSSTSAAIVDQFGQQWQKNTSFRTRPSRELPASVVELIEMLCAPEMELMGYEFQRFTGMASISDVEILMRSHGISETDSEHEINRLCFLKTERVPEGVDSWYISQRVFEILRGVSHVIPAF